MARLIILKRHWLAIILAGVISLIVGLPHVLIPRIISPAKYDPLQFNSNGGSAITMEEVYTYVPEVKEILESKVWVTDTQVAEYNGQSTPFVGETALAWIMAGLARLTGSTQNAFIVADFVFPAVIFLLVYAIVWLFTKSQVVSATAGTVLVIWPELLVLLPYPSALISSIKSAFDPRDFLFISRNFHPQLSLSAYLFAFLLLLMPGLGNPRPGLLRLIFVGLTIGFLFYTYIFNWTAFGLGMGLFFVLMIVLKRSNLEDSRLDLNRLFWRLLIVALVAGLVAVPYFLQVWNFRQSGLVLDFFAKLSLPKRGFFDLVARQWVFVIVFLVIHKVSLYRRKVRPLQTLLFLCFWIAPLLLPDLMQNILGRDLEGKHWVRRIAYPFGIMGLSIAMTQILNKKWIKLICLPLILLVLVYGLVSQTKISYKISDAYSQIPEKQELYDWINQNTAPGAVIASLGWDTVVNIPAKTHAFNFSPIGMRTIAPTEESIDRFLWAAALYGASDEYVEQAFSSRGDGTTRALYFKFAEDNEVFSISPELTQDIKQRYQGISTQNKNGFLTPFKLDYVLIGEMERGLIEDSGGKVNGEIVFSNRFYNLVRYTR